MGDGLLRVVGKPRQYRRPPSTDAIRPRLELALIHDLLVCLDVDAVLQVRMDAVWGGLVALHVEGGRGDDDGLYGGQEAQPEEGRRVVEGARPLLEQVGQRVELVVGQGRDDRDGAQEGGVQHGRPLGRARAACRPPIRP